MFVIALFFSLFHHASAELSSKAAPTLTDLTIVAESGLSNEEMQKGLLAASALATFPNSSNGGSNSIPSVYTGASIPSAYSSGSIPSAFTGGNYPHVYSSGHFDFGAGDGDVPMPKVNL